jgi:serine/threonine protein kinase
MNTGSWSSHEPYMLIGRYALFDELAHGGMATVHVGRLIGPSGFARTVAIKRLHTRFAKDEEFVAMFLDEARMAARLRHPNVVPIHDVVQAESELFLVMDYVEGESLARLLKVARDAGKQLPINVGAAIVAGALHGLHAAHEAKGDDGLPLELVHRDVSPENILVGINGVPRILDFGIAKAAGRAQTTAEGKIKGKIAYMAMEQLGGEDVDRRVDVFSAGVVLWEVLAGRRRYTAPSHHAMLALALEGKKIPPSDFNSEVSESLDALVLRAMERDPNKRFATAREFAFALEEVVSLASTARVGAYVQEMATETLSLRAELIAGVEKSQSDPGTMGPPSDDVYSGTTVIESPSSTSDPFAATAMLDAQPSDANITIETGMSLQAVEQKASNRRLLVVALLVLGGLGLMLAMAFSEDGSQTQDETARSSTPATEPRASAPTVASAPEPPATEVSASSTAGATAPTTSVEPTRAKPEPTRAKPEQGRTKPTNAKPQPAAPKAKPNCNPPYTIDARGVQHIKPECL